VCVCVCVLILSSICFLFGSLHSCLIRLNDACACVDPIQAPGATSAGGRAGDGGGSLSWAPVQRESAATTQLRMFSSVWCIVRACARARV